MEIKRDAYLEKLKIRKNNGMILKNCICSCMVIA